VGIDIADANPLKLMSINEFQNLLVGGDTRLRQSMQLAYSKMTLLQIAQGELANHKGMRENGSDIEQAHKDLVRGAQMMHPDGRIDQDHAGFERRLLGVLSAGSVPPKRARRRALSRSIKALSASRTMADFSRSPV
jgi:hypothetical protein